MSSAHEYRSDRSRGGGGGRAWPPTSCRCAGTTASSNYRAQHRHYRRQEGHKFVLAPWIEGIVEHTEVNRDRHFSAAFGDDAHIIDLHSRPVDGITSLDTHFAGRSLANRRRMMSGREVWMSTDNEGGNTYLDGSVSLLRGDGSVKEVPRIPEQIKFGAPSDPDVEYTTGGRTDLTTPGPAQAAAVIPGRRLSGRTPPGSSRSPWPTRRPAATAGPVESPRSAAPP